MSTDHFSRKAGNYEKNQSRVDNVEKIAGSILDTIDLDKSMQIMDFGSGTGLLLERVAPYVGKITAVDVSSSMNAQLYAKQNDLACPIEILESDLEKSDLNRVFDGIISSMTMHHIKNTEAIFVKFYSMVKENGFIAISDLDLEDGSFHTEDTGVYHSGFDRGEFARFATEAGFRMVKISSVSVVHKPQGDFPVFLLTAIR